MSWATRGMLRLLCGVALSCALVACHGPQATGGSVSSPAAAFTIRGRVSFGPDGAASGLAGRQVQSSITEIAEGSTVSLIDATTGQTVATTVTQPDGAFSLTITGWTPAGGTPYLMEAVKGLKVGENANRAGAAIARVRTIVALEGGGWQSINDSSGGVDIDPGTTALAIAATDEGLSASSELAMMNTYSSGTYSGSVLSASAFTTVTALVNTALAADQDPVDNVVRDPATGTWALRPGNVVIDPEVSPSVISAGGTATFYGQDLPGPESSPSVAIGGLPVASWTINASRSALTVTLPSNGYSGLLTITDGGSTWTGPFLGVHGTVGTLAGSPYAGYVDGPGTIARFNHPEDLTVDSSGDVFVADTGNHRIREISPSGVVSTVAGNGLPGGLDGAALSAEVSPEGIFADATGNVYFTDNETVRELSGGVVSTIAGLSGAGGYADGQGSSARFNFPTGIVEDSGGNLYVTDTNNEIIRKIASGGMVTTLAGSPSVAGPWGGPPVNGTGTAAEFYEPLGLAIDSAGNLYVADVHTYAFREVTPGGTVTTLTSYYSTGAPMTVALNSSGDILTTGNPTAIYEVTPNSPYWTVSTYADPSGTSGFADGPFASAQFDTNNWWYLIVGMAISASGDIYVPDVANNRIRVLVP